MSVHSTDDTATDTIREMVTTIVQEVHPLRILLFGSRARGNYRPRSDVDLLVVMPDEADTRRIRAHLYDCLAGTGLSKDIVVATPARLAAACGDTSSVLHWAQEQGIALYQAPVLAN